MGQGNIVSHFHFRETRKFFPSPGRAIVRTRPIEHNRSDRTMCTYGMSGSHITNNIILSIEFGIVRGNNNTCGTAYVEVERVVRLTPMHQPNLSRFRHHYNLIYNLELHTQVINRRQMYTRRKIPDAHTNLRKPIPQTHKRRRR